MRIAVILSGSMRFQHKSLASVEMLRQHGEVDCHIHTWNQTEDTQRDSWSSHFPVTEATPELVEAYRPKSYVVESWREMRKRFVDQVEHWRRDCGLKTFTHYGMPGMWYSLRSAWDLVEQPHDYDVYVRLRFDCAMLGGCPLGEWGWSIPEAVDFGGINDQLAWFTRRTTEDGKCFYSAVQDVDAYFRTYDHLGRWFETDTPYAPEVLLKKSLDSLYSGPIHRPNYLYRIHGD